MRVLTVKQPNATLIALGIKPVENRSWAPPPAIRDGQRFAIHAGAGWDAEVVRRLGADSCFPIPGRPDQCIRLGDRAAYPSGVIVCTASVAAVLTAATAEQLDVGARIFFRGPLGWLLRNVRLASSLPLKGRLSLWTIADSEVNETQPATNPESNQENQP